MEKRTDAGVVCVKNTMNDNYNLRTKIDKFGKYIKISSEK